MEGAFEKRTWTLIEHSNHTITLLPAGRIQATVISKRDVGYDDQQLCCSKLPMRRIKTNTTIAAQEKKNPTETDVPTENEMPQLSEMANQPIATSNNERANENQDTTTEQTKTAKTAMKELKKQIQRRKKLKEQKKEKKQKRQLRKHGFSFFECFLQFLFVFSCFRTLSREQKQSTQLISLYWIPVIIIGKFLLIGKIQTLQKVSNFSFSQNFLECDARYNFKM